MLVVAVPVHNEAGHIAGLLDALAVQDAEARFEVLLLLNNCRDQTAEIVAAIAPSLPFRVHAVTCELPPQQANAGMARRQAMAQAAILAGAQGVLLTTDADGAPAPNWIRANLAALGQGVEAVAGCAVIDPEDEKKLTPRMIADEENIQRLTTLLDRLDWAVDPVASDPWPRHTQESGASIAVTVQAFHAVGGIPPVASGEDRAFFERLRWHDIAIRHAPDVRVTVSGRLFGRAIGGMAETMLRRMARPDPWLDTTVELADRRLRRALLRQQARAIWRPAEPDAGSSDFAAFCDGLRLPSADLHAALATTHFGAAWHIVVHASALLRPELLRYRACEDEIARAGRLLRQIEKPELQRPMLESAIPT